MLSFLRENLFISKYNIAECDDIENNCVINYDFKEFMVNCEEKLEENNNKDNKEQEIDIIIKGDNSNEKYSSEKLQDIIINLNDYREPTPRRAQRVNLSFIYNININIYKDKLLKRILKKNLK